MIKKNTIENNKKKITFFFVCKNKHQSGIHLVRCCFVVLSVRCDTLIWIFLDGLALSAQVWPSKMLSSALS